MEEKEKYSFLVHNFLDSIRKGDISRKKIIIFLDFVNSLNYGTEIQKRRFIMFYDFLSIERLETFSTIAKKENCTYPAIKNCVSRITCILVNLKNEEKNKLTEIIENNEI